MDENDISRIAAETGNYLATNQSPLNEPDDEDGEEVDGDGTYAYGITIT